MERAIEVMRSSVCEPRDDGKATPLVGAVLVKPDGSVDTACRGELRHGDHAEFTLIERKNRDQQLDGSVLFATLEPCAPGSRAHPKLSCAERIVNARIKRVWVGTTDPDPKVDRKGIKFLQDAGVEVEMFDRDLQDVIREANQEFIAQALERAVTELPASNELSALELPAKSTDLRDLSSSALEMYRGYAAISAEVGSEAFNRRLEQQGVLADAGEGVLLPTGFGLMLFGEHPRDAVPQAGLLATIEYPDGATETKDFDSPLVFVPGAVEEWLKSRLPNIADRGTAHRSVVPALPYEMVRESVVNALVHRDYDIRGAKCQLVVTTDSVVIKSPGGPVPPLRLEDLQGFNAPMLSRNPELHYVFARMELAEERGLGLRSLRERSASAGLPLPRYAWENPYLVLRIFRSSEAAVEVLAPDLIAELTTRERQGWIWASSQIEFASADYVAAIGVTERTAQRDLAVLTGRGLLEKRGAGRATKYRVRQ